MLFYSRAELHTEATVSIKNVGVIFKFACDWIIIMYFAICCANSENFHKKCGQNFVSALILPNWFGMYVTMQMLNRIEIQNWYQCADW